MEYLVFALVIILLSTMDGYNFHRPNDTGFFSLKTHEDKFDIWHTLKFMLLVVIAFREIGFDPWGLFIMACIALVGNYVILHVIFKPKGK